MTNAYVLTGTLTDPQTVRLNEPLPVGGGAVRVTVEVVSPNPSRMTHDEFMADLRRRRVTAGVTPLSADQIDAWVAEVKDARGD